MNKRLRALACAIGVTFSLSLALIIPNTGPFGVDAVSAATGTTTTPTNTTSSTNTSRISGTLRLGSTGSAVKTLQTNLNKYSYNLKVDGHFGPKTLSAVKDYQKAHGLKVDGIAGPKTLAKLIPASTTTTTALRYGNKGSGVESLQTYLNKFSYKLIVDGSFGPKTLAAVKSFQKAHGLVVDGLAGPKTWAKLTATTVTPVTPPDAVTSASIVNDNTAFKNAISAQGKWIICTLKNLTFTEPLKLDGQFLNGKTDDYTGLKTLQRKIGLYTQDAAHVVTARFTLTAPSLTIMSANASIEHGTFKGDLYVSVPGFKLKDATVNGNVYFTTKAAQSTFTMDVTSKVNGTQTLKMPAEVDAVTTPSLVNTEAAFETAIGKTGTWIISTIDNLEFTKDLVLDGDKYNEKTPPVLQRKISLYTQDPNRNVTSRFILKAPSITINSTNGSIEHGTFKGDVYVTGTGFQLKDAIIDGNLYFATTALRDAFKKNISTATSIVTGLTAVKTK